MRERYGGGNMKQVTKQTKKQTNETSKQTPKQQQRQRRASRGRGNSKAESFKLLYHYDTPRGLCSEVFPPHPGETCWLRALYNNISIFENHDKKYLARMNKKTIFSKFSNKREQQTLRITARELLNRTSGRVCPAMNRRASRSLSHAKR